MGKGRTRAVEKRVSGQSSTVSSSRTLNIPLAPVFYPTEEEFNDPLEFIDKIRAEAEPYGICRIVPPKSWKPPFALDLETFTFPTKTQAIHQLQVRSAACDPDTFELEYNRFLEDHCGRKPKKRVVFEGEELDLCKLFNAVKRYGGYKRVVKEKKWGDVFRFIRSVGKVSECSKHVLCQLYREHLHDYESYYNKLTCKKPARKCKRGMCNEESDSKRRRKNCATERVKDNRSDKEEEFDQICEQCNSGLHGEVMLLCDRCDKGWHIYCLSPPLKQVPLGNWYCLECVNSDKETFGFVPGKRFSLEAFRRRADRARKKWFGSANVSRSQIEKKFWQIVEGMAGEVEVVYGSDLDTSLYGSGFPHASDVRPPTIESEVWDKYSSSPWNLNNLPKLQGSMLRAVHDNIAGVMVPWLYVGMLFSSFCWHFEDHCFYSMNYLHWGESKCWYSVPGTEAQAFEQVMRNSLPDLFDAQPDLLFQLVTMLNPSVLQENGVPVYTVLQEPGNFVITFPRSYHGGFNFGLNCAEAVNFAPADWIPHGGFGAELYRLYHKPAVLSHEELLCVVAKTECNGKVSPHLKRELCRIFNKEKNWRERLWRNGIVKSSQMPSRKHPEYVGTEEDPTCIICQQYLYLSAVVCSCRPSTFVCLEHWEHLCECSSRKHRLLYRHTLAELNNLVISIEKCNFEETPQSRTCRRQFSSSTSNAMMKKVKDGRATHAQLAEQWVLNSFKMLQEPFKDAAFVKALKESEQFLWAGPEMEQVRDMTKNLIEAKKWALDVRDCLTKIETWLQHCDHDMGKVAMVDIDKLLGFSPLPCNEPDYIKLKVYAEDARMMLLEINTALSECSNVSLDRLEILHSKARELPIYFDDCKILEGRISATKTWLACLRKCISMMGSTKIEVDILQKLKSEMSELHVQLPEMELLLGLLNQVDLWQIRCGDMLKGPISLKELEILLQDAESCSFSIPELKILRQHHSDAISWISHFHSLLVNIQETLDQEGVVGELTRILEDGESLRVQVDELPLVELELKKACCREKAVKVLSTRMPLDYIQQLMSEANMLQIQSEKLFVKISGELLAAISWEERVSQVLGTMAPISEFEEAFRASEEIFVVLPSLGEVKDILAVAQSWLRRSQSFLVPVLSTGNASRSLRKVDALKDLVEESKLLKAHLEEPKLIQTILKECESWGHLACSLLECAGSLCNVRDLETALNDGLTHSIEELLNTIQSTTEAGISLAIDFSELSTLQSTSSKLRWCLKGLSFCSRSPSLEEVESLLEDAKHLSIACLCNNLESLLITGVKWLQKALDVFPKCPTKKRCKLVDVEEILLEYERIRIPFPSMIAQLVNAIEKHKSWQSQVNTFFNSRPEEQSWSALSHLKELGKSDAFDSLELDMVTCEIVKIEKWILCCKNVIEPMVDEMNPLCSSLAMIKHHMDRSLGMCQELNGCKVEGVLLCCMNESEDQVLVCSRCKDRYHLQCMYSTHATHAKTNATKDDVCSHCLCIEKGLLTRNGCHNMISRRKKPELKMLVELLSAADDFCIRIEEMDMVQKIVEQALTCRKFLTDIANSALGYLDRDVTSISQKLLLALKALAVAGVYDNEAISYLELALARHSWKVRAKKLLEGSQKPLIQQIQRMLKEGPAVKLPPEDFFVQKVTELKCIALQWADNAKKVASDSGALALDEVFVLIAEGENLPVHVEKELKLLRDRTVLYCICRKPYDQRAMIACDRCDEWYHFDCVNLHGPPPKTYFCPACTPFSEPLLHFSPMINHEERSNGSEDVGPQTPSPRCTESKRPRKLKASRHKKKLVVADLSEVLRQCNGIDQLWWRTRKPLRRTSRKRAELHNLSAFFHMQM